MRERGFLQLFCGRVQCGLGEKEPLYNCGELLLMKTRPVFRTVAVTRHEMMREEERA